jgi:hypothetical protein
MLGLFGAPLLQAIGLRSIKETLEAASYYGGAQGVLIVVEVFGGIGVFLVWPIVLLVQFFQKKKEFPGNYVRYAIAGAAFVFVDLALTWVLFADVMAAAGIPLVGPDTARGTTSALASLFIWVPYMFNSVRVKNTFVN